MRNLVASAVCVLAFSVTALTQDATHAPHWGYSGAEGPNAWGSLKPEYQVCQFGKQQSPIDIKDAKKGSLPAIQFDYKPAALNVVNNGHTILVNYPPGSFITVGDKKYELKQFHFHHPSEEKINGKTYDMVAHLVHADADGRLAVVAVLLRKGAANPMLRRIWDEMPKEEGPAREVAGVEVNAAALLPTSTAYYTFPGSLTTPPCSEGVTWFVLKTPSEISVQEIETFSKIYPYNARPVQPANERAILESQ